MLNPQALLAPVADRKIIGLAVSGGADSLALMLLCAEWLKAGNRPRAIVYTLDHRLRPEAAAEAAMVARHARELGLPVRILHWEGEKPTTGVQATARAARYQLIGTAMAEDGAEILLTAHHRRDQAETLLMRMAHGSGVSGLSGMRAFSQVEGITVFRPLLDTDSEALSALVAGRGWTPAVDPSNTDPTYERIRWRQALPGLASLGLTEARLALLAKRLQRADALAETATENFWNQYAAIDSFGVVAVDLAALPSAGVETGIRVLSRALARTGGGSWPELAAIEAVFARLVAGPFKGETLGGACFVTQGNTLLVFREAGRMADAEQVLVPGTRLVWDKRFVIMADTGGLSVRPAHGLTRAGAQELLGAAPGVPMNALAAAPLVTDAAGRILALGTQIFSPGGGIAHLALT